MTIRAILDYALQGKRLQPDDLSQLLASEDWTRIVAAGHQRRNALHDPESVSYTAFRVVNYTNFCDVDCSFCSFKDEVGSSRGYVLDLDTIAKKTEEAMALGADQIFFQGGVNPDLPLSYYLDAFRMLTTRYGVHVRGLSPVEIYRLAEKLECPLPQLLAQLKEAGLGSVPGAGAEILSDRMRSILSPKKLPGSLFCEVMGECHKAGLPGSVNIVIGSEENQDDVLEHLTLLRDQQDRTHGFLSFVAWTFQPQTKRFKVKHVPAWDYLKLVAIARLWFDNIPHIEVSILGLGKEVGELALRSGADDINSIVIEENVLRSSGLKTLRAAERFITEAGFKPKRRSLNYEFDKYENNWPKHWARPAHAEPAQS
jgi:cyclic dehypoxanthinyl futalosine synthase